jgi:uncharacterized membrane protein
MTQTVTDNAKSATTGAASGQVTKLLGEAARGLVQAQGQKLLDTAQNRVTDLTDRLDDVADNGGQMGPLTDGLRRTAEGDSPAKAALGAVGSSVKEKLKSAVGGGKGKGGAPKATVIVEEVDVGVPLATAYDQWTQFEEFSKFMKGVESVDQQDEVEANWRGKVAKSRRTWTSKIREQVPDERIVWTSEGAKGSVNGVVTFHALADDLTRMLVTLEYYPSGLFEKTANIWRAPGRRARLDLKHFRRFIMTEGEATGSWRGEIRDYEVVSEPGDEQRDDDEDGEHEDDEPRDEEPRDEDEEPRDEEPRDEDEEPRDEAEEEPEERPRRARSSRGQEQRRAPVRRR